MRFNHDRAVRLSVFVLIMAVGLPAFGRSSAELAPPPGA